MNKIALQFSGIVLALGLAPVAHATADDLRSVAGMQHHNRVLLVFAPTLTDQRLEAQRQAMGRFGAKAATRDLLFVQVAGDKVIGANDPASRLRAKFKAGPGDYRTLLIGKDGNVALTEAGPIDEARIEGTIDAMPMRRAEVARAKAGLGKPSN